MDQSVSLAAIAAFSAFLAVASPLLLAYLNNLNIRKSKQEDWARQDEVANKVAEAADLLLARQDKVENKVAEAADLLLARQDEVASKVADAADLLLASNEKLDGNVKNTNEKLDVVHILVNSQFTAALKSELASLSAQLVLMRELIAMKKADGKDSNGESATTIIALADKIIELKATLADREKQQKVIADSIATADSL